jgi:hypothetical protein
MMQQDPKKEPKDYEKPSVKQKLKQYSANKKAPVKQVGEMGKPSLKAEFEADMQKERDFVLKRAKQREEAEKMIRMAPKAAGKGAKLKSMSKKSISEKIIDGIPTLLGFKVKDKY